MKDGTRELAVIMFTDLVGYSSLAQKDEQLSLELLELHQNIMENVVKEHRGQIIKTIGDAFLVKFTSATMAVNCALQMQKAQDDAFEGQSPESQFKMRIGIHLGEIINHKGDIYGDGVNVASRVEPQAKPGGICISKAVYEQVYKTFKQRLVSIGERDLKNIDKPVELFNIEPGNLTATKVIDITKMQEKSLSKLKMFTKKKAMIVSSTILIAIALGIVFFQTKTFDNSKSGVEIIRPSRGRLFKQKIDKMTISNDVKARFHKLYDNLLNSSRPKQAKIIRAKQINQLLINFEYQEKKEAKKHLETFEKISEIDAKIQKILVILTDHGRRKMPRKAFGLIHEFERSFRENNIEECIKILKEFEVLSKTRKTFDNSKSGVEIIRPSRGLPFKQKIDEMTISNDVKARFYKLYDNLLNSSRPKRMKIVRAKQIKQLLVDFEYQENREAKKHLETFEKISEIDAKIQKILVILTDHGRRKMPRKAFGLLHKFERSFRGNNIEECIKILKEFEVLSTANRGDLFSS